MALRSQRAEILVGLFVVLGLAILGWLILQFSQHGGRPSDGYPLTVEVRDAAGIREGVPVRLGGVDIGHVASDPDLGEDFTSVDIELTIYPDRKIPRQSLVKIGTSGLMGDSFIRVEPPVEPSEAYFAAGDHIRATPSGTLNDLAGSAEETLERVGDAVEEMEQSIRRVDEVFAKLQESVLDQENVDNLRVLLTELRASSEHIHAAAKKIDPVIEETSSAMNGLHDAAATANHTFATMNDGAEKLTATLESIDPVLGEFDETLDHLRVTLGQASGMIDQIESGDGLAGALLNDTELKNDLRSFIDKLDRHGVLFYPRGKGLFNQSSEKKETAGTKGEAPSQKKRPFAWLKRRP
ncbi:MAG: MlaD family protein [Verrucomicrobiales bacterium]